VARDGLNWLRQRMRARAACGPESGIGTLVPAPSRHELTTIQVTGGGARALRAVPWRAADRPGPAAPTGRLSHRGHHRAVLRGRSPGRRRRPGVAGAARPHGRGTRGGCQDRAVAGAAGLGHPGDRGPPAPRGHLRPGARGDAARNSTGPGRPRSSGRRGPSRARGIRPGRRYHGPGWLAGVDGLLVLGNYVLARGAASVHVASTVDALTVHLLGERRDAALAFLATPTEVFGEPAEAATCSARAYATRSRAANLGSWPRPGDP
jgi:hypothetical protein